MFDAELFGDGNTNAEYKQKLSVFSFGLRVRLRNAAGINVFKSSIILDTSFS